jgi:hypothetical protein
MKAKDYVAQYIKIKEKNGDSGALFWLVDSMLTETRRLIKERKIRTNGGLSGILREMQLKWEAICRRMPNELNQNGFKEFCIRRIGPEFRYLF